MKILNIDDNEEITDLMTLVFSELHHEIITCTSSKKGLELIKEKKFDVILLDIAMPDFSGIDLVENLLNNGPIDKYNIVLFTASEIPNEKINELIKQGVKTCLKKPVNLDELLETINKFRK